MIPLVSLFFGLLRKKSQQELPQLRFYNTLSGEVESFVPLNHTVRMYNCGPTVYAQQTIGNLRGPLLANLVRRTLEVWGYPVKHVSNITDVGHLVSDSDEGEDKMEESAKKQKRSAQDIAHEYTQLFFDDLDALGINRKKIMFTPATEYVGEQIALVQSLEQKGYTYRISDGIYFDTSKFPAYGKLGHIDLAGQKEGARVEENKEKKNPHDFALWKFSPKRQKRQQEWQSPWGKGFPGWHIECTAMIFKTLGKQIDIHIGGIDLIPVHHNNEIAQAEASTGKPFVHYWMHNAFITIEGKKISKSLGNTVYLHNIVDKGFSPRALRYWYLTGHYRQPMNFTWEAIEGADTAFKRLQRAYLEYEAEIKSGGEQAAAIPENFKKDFLRAIADDLNTAKAIALLWDMIKDDTVSPAEKHASLQYADKILGLGLADKRITAKLTVIEQQDLPQEVQDLLATREEARANKEFAKADELRVHIEAFGFEVTDTPSGAQITPKS